MREIRASVAAVAALVALGVAAGRAQEPVESTACGPGSSPSLPARPDSVPVPPADPPPYRPWSGMRTTIDLGVGAVRPAPEAPWDHAWILRVEVPVFAEPGGALAGWIVEGWWVPREGAPRRLGIDPMVEIGYEVPGWVALEERGGWVRIRWGAAEGDGAGWVSPCHLAASDPPLAFAPWASVMGSPLFFRSATPHALRAGPGTGHERRFWITGDDHDAMIERLEVRGDWMRVRVTRPSTYCVTDPPPDVRVDEGWIRWRDDAMGPWVWWFTRGC